MGISRSATVVAAYLVFRHGLTPLQAVAWIRAQRPIVNPNPGFKEQLDDYYSVLQMDHGAEFGWRKLSMCRDFQMDQLKEALKRKRRQRTEKIRGNWKSKRVEWVRCSIIGWDEGVERQFQEKISAF